MYRVSNLLNAHSVNNETINTPNGILIMADNEDGTYTEFSIDTDLSVVYTYLGY